MYKKQATQNYCEQIGLAFSEADFNDFALRAEQENLTQEQLDFVLREHAWRLKVLFTPKKYSIKQRILLALHFLNPFAEGV